MYGFFCGQNIVTPTRILEERRLATTLNTYIWYVTPDRTVEKDTTADKVKAYLSQKDKVVTDLVAVNAAFKGA